MTWFLVPLATIILAWLWPLCWYAAVQGRVSCTIGSERRECEAGEGVPVEIDVTNNSFVPLPFVEVRIRLPEGLSFHPSVTRPNLCVVSRVWIRSRARIRIQVYGIRRGPHVLSDVSVVGHEGFGLAVRPLASATSACWLAVRPVRRASHTHLPHRMLQGLRATPRALVEDETWIRGVRPYEYGDPVRHIDWRATARLGNLVVKQFFPTTHRHFLVVLNAQMSEPLRPKGRVAHILDPGVAGEHKAEGYTDGGRKEHPDRHSQVSSGTGPYCEQCGPLREGGEIDVSEAGFHEAAHG
ncbi:DUF58 domain-containing protein [Alicyclobacillus sendaiensis PA2]|uniref:DUF58 domain-containing protein n=1 Tax=Alicyclobacillus sendaiensis PA2 TaxID=3029425 RepID=A0ABT6XX01_ALISE|nr:DUF58 domain-containing protein [Alicyclobacillus sendaiensis PA2]